MQVEDLAAISITVSFFTLPPLQRSLLGSRCPACRLRPAVIHRSSPGRGGATSAMLRPGAAL